MMYNFPILHLNMFQLDKIYMMMILIMNKFQLNMMYNFLILHLSMFLVDNQYMTML